MAKKKAKKSKSSSHGGSSASSSRKKHMGADALLASAPRKVKNNYGKIALISSGAYLVWRNRDRIVDAVRSLPMSDSIENAFSSIARVFTSDDASGRMFGRA